MELRELLLATLLTLERRRGSEEGAKAPQRQVELEGEGEAGLALGTTVLVGMGAFGTCLERSWMEGDNARYFWMALASGDS